MASPISSIEREKFINSNVDSLPNTASIPDRTMGRPSKPEQDKTKRVTFTFTPEDLRILDEQLNRAVSLGYRDKGKTGVLRMALRALEARSDDDYMEAYHSVQTLI